MPEAQILAIVANLDEQRRIQQSMEPQGYVVLFAEDGLAGLALARETTPVLVLLDTNLPGFDGYATATRLGSLAHLRTVPIVALSADTSPGAREQALIAGCAGTIALPLDDKQLPQLVAAYLNGQREQVANPTVAAELLHTYTQRLVAQLEHQARELNATYVERQDLDRLKGQFLSTLSHELRTPLTVMMGYLELFERGILGSLSDTQREVVTVMRNSGTTLAHQLNNLLNFQELRGRAMKFQTVHPSEALQPVLGLMQARASAEGLTLEIEAGGETAILADAEAFGQLIRELLDNALKFTDAGGQVRLSLQDEPSRLILRVADTGQGIAQEHLQKIFLPFYRVETPHVFVQPGAGLGLAIAHHIVEAHGGQITVRSQSGQGSVFTVVLPRTSAAL